MRLELATLAVIDSVALPVGVSGDTAIVCDEAGNVILAHDRLWRWDHVQWVELVANIDGAMKFLYSKYGWRNGVYYILNPTGQSPLPGDDVGLVMSVRVANALESVSLQDVVETVCHKAGIDPDFVNAAALAAKEVRALAVTPATARQVLDMLSVAFFFEAVCSNTLRFVNRGGAPVATIPWLDLARPSPARKLSRRCRSACATTSRRPRSSRPSS